MRVRSLEKYIDRLFWAIIALLPIFAYLINLIHFSDISFATYLSQFNVLSTNVVYDSLAAFFGSNGYLPYIDTTSTNPALLYFSYFVFVELAHIIIDVLLFIPRIAVKLLDKSTEMGGSHKW